MSGKELKILDSVTLYFVSGFRRNYNNRLLKLAQRPMKQVCFATGNIRRVCSCGRLRNEKTQVVFGLKIANVGMIILFYYVNPFRGYPNKAMRQVMT